jgi:hypothetical protein
MLVAGLEYNSEFLSELDEADLLESIDSAAWSHDLKPRVQH